MNIFVNCSEVRYPGKIFGAGKPVELVMPTGTLHDENFYVKNPLKHAICQVIHA